MKNEEMSLRTKQAYDKMKSFFYTDFIDIMRNGRRRWWLWRRRLSKVRRRKGMA